MWASLPSDAVVLLVLQLNTPAARAAIVAVCHAWSDAITSSDEMVWRAIAIGCFRGNTAELDRIVQRQRSITSLLNLTAVSNLRLYKDQCRTELSKRQQASTRALGEYILSCELYQLVNDSDQPNFHMALPEELVLVSKSMPFPFVGSDSHVYTQLWTAGQAPPLVQEVVNGFDVDFRSYAAQFEHLMIIYLPGCEFLCHGQDLTVGVLKRLQYMMMKTASYHQRGVKLISWLVSFLITKPLRLTALSRRCVLKGSTPVAIGQWNINLR